MFVSLVYVHSMCAERSIENKWMSMTNEMRWHHFLFYASVSLTRFQHQSHRLANVRSFCYLVSGNINRTKKMDKRKIKLETTTTPRREYAMNFMCHFNAASFVNYLFRHWTSTLQNILTVLLLSLPSGSQSYRLVFECLSHTQWMPHQGKWVRMHNVWHNIYQYIYFYEFLFIYIEFHNYFYYKLFGIFGYSSRRLEIIWYLLISYFS